MALMDGIIDKVVISVAATLVLSAITLLFASVRSALFYRRVEYEFTYTRGTGPCQWDIQWEGFRLTILVERVSNDYLHNVTFKRNKRKDKTLGDLEPSDEFINLFGNEIQVRLSSIVRKQQGETADYVLRFTFRRARLRRRVPNDA